MQLSLDLLCDGASLGLAELAGEPGWGVKADSLRTGDTLQERPTFTEGIGWWHTGFDWSVVKIFNRRGRTEVWARPAEHGSAQSSVIEDLSGYRLARADKPDAERVA